MTKGIIYVYNYITRKHSHMFEVQPTHLSDIKLFECQALLFYILSDESLT